MNANTIRECAALNHWFLSRKSADPHTFTQKPPNGPTPSVKRAWWTQHCLSWRLTDNMTDANDAH